MTVYVVVGLCGSGKSMFMMDMQQRGDVREIIHDYYAGSLRETDYVPTPEASKFYDKLVEAIDSNINIAVADPLFVMEDELGKFVNFLKEIRSDVQIELICFTNEPDAAKENIKVRLARRNGSEEELEKFFEVMDTVSPGYRPEKYRAVMVPTYGGKFWER